MSNKNFSTAENNAIERMRALMNYGRINENKQVYSGIEYTKVGADGKTYGIIREGHSYFMKVADKKNPLVEDFDYVGGFRNRKDYEYSSFANAQKNFDMKMRSINEAYRTPDMVIESWENKGENNQVITEATKKMQEEIARQREIMMNVNLISESKPQVLKAISEKKSCASAPFCEEPDKEFKDSENNNIEKGKVGTGDAKKANPEYEDASVKGTDIKENEVLGFNRDNKDYMDKTHGTEIGDTAPFDDKTKIENGVVEEGESMHDSDDQNTPAPGTGEIGDAAPFNENPEKKLDEAIDDIETEVDVEDDSDDDDIDLGDEGMDDVEDLGSEEEETFGDEDGDEEVVDIESDDEIVDDDEDESVEERLDALEDLMRKIAQKMGVETYSDEPLYDEEGDEDELGAEEEVPAEDDELDIEEPEDNFDDDAEEEIEDCMTFESKAYRAMKLREAQKLNDFGKHPAYQKTVMSLPKNGDAKKKKGYYDMNDKSVKGDKPYGQKIGDNGPFDVDVDTITNAIAESIKNILKKK